MTKKDLTSETKPDTFDVAAEARRRGVQPYVVRATGAVGDKLVADIVSDFYRPISKSASMIPDPPRSTEPVTKGNGWCEPRPMSPPRGYWRETPEEKQERVARQQERENAEMEARVAGDDGPKIEHEYNPFSRKWMER